MNQPQHLAANPFALLMDPQSVFMAIEKSERLARLHSRVCRPLDKPMLPVAAADAAQAGEVEDDGFEMELPGEEI
jgi:hypothetical protein